MNPVLTSSDTRFSQRKQNCCKWLVGGEGDAGDGKKANCLTTIHFFLFLKRDKRFIFFSKASESINSTVAMSVDDTANIMGVNF